MIHRVGFLVAAVLLLLSVSSVLAQQTDVLDVTQIRARVDIFPSEKRVVGTQMVWFKVLKDTDSVYLDAVEMKILQNKHKEVAVKASANKIWLIGSFKKDESHFAEFTFEVSPKKALYFTQDQFWTQGQGKYTSHWLPSIDDMNDKIEFDLTYRVPEGNMVIANGENTAVESIDEKTIWSYDMEQPMSSYLVAFAGGNFDKLELRSASGLPIELYFRPEDSLKAEPTYRYTKEIFDFLEEEIGVPYPWQNYKQVPVRDFLYAGMENTTVTIFSEAFVVDSIGFVDRNYVNVNAHELAHQWFGNLVTETEGTHHWLHEGFATYYALLAEREIFGADYYYWKLLQTAEQLEEMSQQGQGQSLLDPKASSLTFYEKGAWALHVLKELIGEQAFKNAITSYLNNYQFKNVTTDDFLREVREASLVDISDWEADWLRQTAFKAEQAYQSLIKSEFIRNYFDVAALRANPLAEHEQLFEQLLSEPNDFIAQEVVDQLGDESLETVLPLFKIALDSDNTLVRQAVAGTLTEIPKEIKSQFELLLEDPSYLTKELALAALWVNFPEDRKKYLEKTKYLIGFQNKNIKLMWLTMAISTEAYGASANEIFISELKEYSSARYSFEVRQLAFDYLFELQLFDAEVLENLVNASVHHYWRFRDYSRRIIDEMLKVESLEKRLKEVVESLPIDEGRYVRSKLEKK